VPDQKNRFESPSHAPEKMMWGQLRPHVILPKLLKHALTKVPRSTFVPACYQECCYHDDNIPLREKHQKQRFLLAPLTLGKLFVHADLETISHKKALILWGGTGYSAALFGQMNIDCIMIENHIELADQATENLTLYPNVFVKSMPIDLINYVLGEDFFDIIFIDGGAIESIPSSLLEKLTPTGFLLALQQQKAPCLDKLSLCWGVKISREGISSILFDVWAPVNQDFNAPSSFGFFTPRIG
jgi:protein-L-isoaspartate O-methyltransferase